MFGGQGHGVGAVPVFAIADDNGGEEAEHYDSIGAFDGDGYHRTSPWLWFAAAVQLLPTTGWTCVSRSLVFVLQSVDAYNHSLQGPTQGRNIFCQGAREPFKPKR